MKILLSEDIIDVEIKKGKEDRFVKNTGADLYVTADGMVK